MTSTVMPPRQRAAKPSDRVDRFFRRHLHHRGGYSGQSFIPDPWQREVHQAIFDTRDRSGLRIYNEALIGISKGNGKTPDGAGIALYGLFADHEPDPECYVVAGSRSQAGILFNDARAMVEASPYLRAASKIYRSAIELREGGVFRVLSSDASLAHGYRPHVVGFDEVWTHKKRDLYDAFASALHKRRQPLLFGMTTAGFDRESLLWSLIERGRAGTDPSFFYRWWGAPDGCSLTDVKAWRAANPATFVTDEELRKQLRRLPEAVFRRLHMNQWTSNEDIWIALQLWDASGEFNALLDPACAGIGQDEHGVRIPEGARVWVGVDAAPKRDTTAVVVVWRTDAGHHYWRHWIFERDPNLGYLDYGAVEDLLRQLHHDMYQVERIVVDPFTMMRSMIMLAEEGLPIEEYPQNDARMVPASQTLFDLVIEQRLHHGGVEELRRQCAHAEARETSRGWRLHKLKSSGPIDGMVAGAMASHIAEQDASNNAPMVWAFEDDELDEPDGDE